MAKKEATAARKIPNEDRVRNSVVGHIASQGYSKNLQVKANDQRGVDIYATHVNSVARRIFIEAKGHTPGANKTLAILIAWGQLLSRVTSVNANRIHGLAFPKDWEGNVARLSSNLVARRLNVHYFFVDTHGDVEELTAAQFERRHRSQRSIYPTRRSKRRVSRRSARG